MNRKQRNNLYMVAMKRYFLDGKEILDFNNGDILRIKASEDQYFSGISKNVEVPSMALQVAVANLEGNVTYLGTYHKALGNYQSVDDILKASEIEKIDFILKKEEGFLKGSSYHLVENYGGKLDRQTSEDLNNFSEEILEALKNKLEVPEKDVKDNQSLHTK